MINPHHITQACRRTQDALLIATEKPSPKPQNGGGGGSSIEAPTPLPVTLISAKRIAQAIIDELELTVESGVVFHKVTQEGVWTKSDPQARIVGKWEVEQ